MFGRLRRAAGRGSACTFVSPAALEAGLAERLDERPAPGRRSRDVRRRGKADLPSNDALPDIEVDPDTFTVRDRRRASSSPHPADELPMAQRYFLF